MDNQPQQPFETPYIPYVPPTPPKNERTGLKRAGIALLIFVALSGVGVSAYALMKNSSLKDDLASEKSKSEALLVENGKLKNADVKTGTITEGLPNGKSISYADTEANRSIIWWSTNPDSADSQDVITLSHAYFQQFLSTLDNDLITQMCGDDSSPIANKYNISVGTFDTATKTFTPSEDTNCVEVLASTDNTDETSRNEAQQVVDKTKADVNEFVNSATIK